MLASTLLVTLRGTRKMIDLELPGDVAVGELLPLLVEICGEGQNDPQALSQADVGLQVAGAYTLLPLGRTLVDVGVCSGTVLVLHTQERARHEMAQHGQITPPYGFGPRWVPPGVETGGVGVTWEPLL